MSDFDPKDIHKDVTADFAPEDISPEKMGAGQAALLGAEQGLTLGNSDEMSGGIGAGLDKTQALMAKLGLAEPSPTEVNAKLASEGTQGKFGPKSTLDLYKEMRDEERAKIKKGAEDQPGATLAGNVGGAALLAPFAGTLSPFAAEAGAGIGTNIATGIGNAVLPGAIAGLGTSDESSIGGQLYDAGAGAMGAGLIGGTIPAVGAAIKGTTKGIGNFVSNNKSYQDLIGKYAAGKAGFNISDPGMQLQGRDLTKQLAGQIDDSMRDKTSDLFTAKGNILKNLETTGIKSDTADVLKEFADTVGNSTAMRDEEIKPINKVIAKHFEKGFDKSPYELENLLKDFKDLKGNVQTDSARTAIDTAAEKIKDIQSGLSPELAHLNNGGFETIDAAKAITGRDANGYRNAQQDLAMRNKLATKLENASSDVNTQSDINDILGGKLTTSKNRPISPLGDIAPEATNAIKKGQEIGNYMRLAKEQQSPSFRGGNVFESTANAIGGVGGLAANKTGLAVKASQDFLKSGVDYLSNLDQQALGGVGAKMAQIGGKAGEQFAKVLQDASTKNPQSRNAMIFGLMQQPEFREMYHQINGVNTSTMKMPEENTSDFDSGDTNGQ